MKPVVKKIVLLLIFLMGTLLLMILTHLLLFKIGFTIDEGVSGVIGVVFGFIALVGLVLGILWITGNFNKTHQK